MALNGTMELIETVTVGSGGAASIDFTSIPQTYTDLKIVISGRSSSTPAEGMYIAFNGSTSNFSGRYLIGDGANASSGVLARYVGSIFGAVGTASVFNNTEVYIPNYTSSNNKSFSVDNVAENNATAGYQNLIAGLWSSSSAITSISITCTGFTQHSTATLYGISKVPAIAKAYGGTITYDNNYVYHTFYASTVFTPLENLSVDYLVVAGGGGGGMTGGNGTGGGGGGGGGYRTSTGFSLISGTDYTVTVGAGGAGSTVRTSAGASGSNSVFSSITSAGGGGGAGDNASPATLATAGGSGGGGSGGSSAAGQQTGAAGNTPSTSPSQGNSGGNGYSGGGGGGGGGAGSAGVTTSSAAGANGGAGTASSITGSSVSRAGGGGGAAQYLNATEGIGQDGGGNGADSTTAATNATANTGGGGGGGHGQSVGANGSNGGSGIVIVRYAR